jgi:hypothetical protein
MVFIIGMSEARTAVVRSPAAAGSDFMLLVGRVIPARCSRWRETF